MCGIAGIILKNPKNCIDVSQIEKMCDAIYHRGPDEWGHFVKGSVGIGMRRLSIIDLAGGTQPIHNEDQTVWIVFNGEIYNYRDLRSSLEKKGHNFYTNSDTESIIHLYEQYGEDCVKHLRGMFAFAIWDAKTETLFLARDRLGIKPLHYYEDGNQFVFGSEIKSILACEGVHREVHKNSIVNYRGLRLCARSGNHVRGYPKTAAGSCPHVQKRFIKNHKILGRRIFIWTATAGGILHRKDFIAFR